MLSPISGLALVRKLRLMFGEYVPGRAVTRTRCLFADWCYSGSYRSNRWALFVETKLVPRHQRVFQQNA